MRKRKIHFQDKSTKEQHPICGVKGGAVAFGTTDVDCLNCWRIIGDKTTEQGGPKERKGKTASMDDITRAMRKDNELVDLIVTTQPVSRIGVIRAIREISGLGLAEAKAFSDNVRDHGSQTLFTYISPHQALEYKKRLDEAGATVALVSSTSRKPISAIEETATGKEYMGRLKEFVEIEQAYREMLAFFVRDDKMRTMVEQMNEDGNGTIYWGIEGKPPTIADICRWLAAGGAR